MRLASFFNGTFSFDRNTNNPLTQTTPSPTRCSAWSLHTESNEKLNGHARYKNIEWFVQDN
jgi:hypothetical protein